jgi:hypothetical protein
MIVLLTTTMAPTGISPFKSHFSFLQSLLHKVFVSENIFHQAKNSNLFVHLPYVKIYFQVFITLDLRQLDEVQLPQLAQELRDFIIDIVSVKEGHLGASLGD